MSTKQRKQSPTKTETGENKRVPSKKSSPKPTETPSSNEKTSKRTVSDGKKTSNKKQKTEQKVEQVDVKAVDVKKVDSGTQKQERKQKSKQNGLLMSVPRVRKFMDRYGVNKHYDKIVDVLIKSKTESVTLSAEEKDTIEQAYKLVYTPRLERYNEYQSKLSAGTITSGHKKYKSVVNFKPRTDSVEEKVDVVNKLKYRFSSSSTVALSAVLEYITHGIVKSAIMSTIVSEKSIVTIHSLFSDISDKSWFPILKDTEEFKKFNLSAQVEDKVEEDSKEDDKETSLDFCINTIFKSVKTKLLETDKKYENVKIGKKFREFCSQLLLQLISRYNCLFKLCTEYNKCKTITDDTVLFVTRMLMVDSGVSDPLVLPFVYSKLKRK